MHTVIGTPLPTFRDHHGMVVTVHDLPSPETVRWVPTRKRLLVKAVEHQLLSLEEFCVNYNVTEQEFEVWRNECAGTGEIVSLFLPQRPYLDRYVRGRLTIFSESRKMAIGDIEVRLTKFQHKILFLLGYFPEQTFSQLAILEYLYREEPEWRRRAEEKTVDVHIHKIRKKIRNIYPQFDPIETVWGRGYKLRKN